MFLFGIKNKEFEEKLISDLSKDWGPAGLNITREYLNKPHVDYGEICDMNELPKKWREICFKNYEIIIWLDNYFELIDDSKEERALEIIPAYLLYRYIFNDHYKEIPCISGRESTNKFLELCLDINSEPDKYPYCVIYDYDEC